MDVPKKKVISIVTSCWNEVENIPLYYERCKKAVEQHPEYDYEFVTADNLSTDGTREVLREIAAKDPKFKVILNANNFGHVRSPFYAMLNCSGDIMFFLCSDLQEPPEMLHEFLKKYEEGYPVVYGVRTSTQADFLLECFRKIYYFILKKSGSNEKVISCFTGFGLYDRCFIDALKKFNEPHPYFRGFFSLYDLAMTGFVNHTKLPLRLAIFSGFVIGIFSVLIALAYLVIKLIWWDTFNLGLAPLVIGMFFLGAVQLFFIGIIGEYIGAIHTQVKNKPLVIEEERINF